MDTKMGRVKLGGRLHTLVLVLLASGVVSAFVGVIFSESALAVAFWIGLLLLGVLMTFYLGREWVRSRRTRA